MWDSPPSSHIPGVHRANCCSLFSMAFPLGEGRRSVLLIKSTEWRTDYQKPTWVTSWGSQSWDGSDHPLVQGSLMLCRAQGQMGGSGMIHVPTWNLAPSHLFKTAPQSSACVTSGWGDILFLRIGPDRLLAFLQQVLATKKKCLEMCGVHEQMASWKRLLKFPLCWDWSRQHETSASPTRRHHTHLSWVSFSLHSHPALENTYPCLNTSTKQTHAEMHRLYCLKYSLVFSMEDYSSLPH